MAVREAHEHDPPVTAELEGAEAEAQLEARLGDGLKHLIEIVRFGQETELFLKEQPVARYLVERAERQMTEATRQLLDMNSLEGTKAAKAHFNARVAVAILRWLDEAVTQGREAELAIQGLDDAER